MERFAQHLGSRLYSVCVKRSVARGDAVWGISDLDLVLGFDTPAEADTQVKHAAEQTVRQQAGQVVICYREEPYLPDASPLQFAWQSVR